MYRSFWRIPILFILGIALIGCGDDDSPIKNDVEPQLIAGGGTTGGAIAGRLNIYVIDGKTEKALANAYVMIGNDQSFSGTTDAQGLITFRDESLKGPLTVTVGLKTYTTSTIVGLNAANTTLTLNSRSPSSSSTIDTATCSGTIKDWDNLPALEQNQVRIGYIGYLLDSDLGSERNNIEQADEQNIFAPILNKNAWTLTLPSGNVAVYGFVLTIDSKGTASEDDDERWLTHIGIVKNLSIQKDQSLSNIEIPVVALDQTLSVKIPTLPLGLDTSEIGTLIDMGDSGLIPVFFASEGNPIEYPMPSLSGDFADASYWIMASATIESTNNVPAPQSILLKRGITDISQVFDISLLDLPSDINLSGDKLSYNAPTESSLQSIQIYPEQISEGTVWELIIADGSTSLSDFNLPPLPQTANVEQLPQGNIYLSVSAMELDNVDLNNTEFKSLEDKVLRMSEKSVALTR